MSYDEYDEEYEVERTTLAERIQLLEQLKTLKEQVAYVLENYPETRNSDLYLWLILIRTFHPEASRFIKYIPYEVFKKFPNFETVARLRRKFNEEGLFLPTDLAVLRRRRRLEKLFRETIHKV